MKVREFIQMQIDIDVLDDVCEELCIAFVGPQALTEAGIKEFSEVLDYEVTICTDGGGSTWALIHVDGPDGVWQDRLEKAKHFFHAAAGYCPVSDYETWFPDD